MSKTFHFTNGDGSIKTGYILSFILLLAFVLRLWGINQPYVDIIGWRQCSVAMMAENFFRVDPNIFFPAINWSGPGPGYNGREFQTISYIASLLYRLFGQHDAIGRCVALVFGLWGVFATYKLVEEVWDKRSGLAAAFLMAIMPSPILFDRSFIPDPVMVSLVVTGVWLLLVYLRSGSRKFIILAAVTLCLGFLTKIPGMLTGIAIAYALLYMTIDKRKLDLKRFVPVVIAGVAILIVVAAYYLWARYLSTHYPPYHFAGSDGWVWSQGLVAWMQQGYFLDRFLYCAKDLLWGWPALCLFLVGIIFFNYREPALRREKADHEYRKPVYLFHFWALGCIVFYAIGAQELVDNFWNFHIFSPVVAAFAARGLILLTTFGTRSKAFFLIRFGVIVLILAWVNYPVWRYLRTPFYQSEYEMGTALRNYRQDGEPVVVLGREFGSPVSIFYTRSKGWVFPPAGKDDWASFPKDDTTAIRILKDLQRQGAGWFAVVAPQYEDIRSKFPVFESYLTTQNNVRLETKEYVLVQLKKPIN